MASKAERMLKASIDFGERPSRRNAVAKRGSS